MYLNLQRIFHIKHVRMMPSDKEIFTWQHSHKPTRQSLQEGLHQFHDLLHQDPTRTSGEREKTHHVQSLSHTNLLNNTFIILCVSNNVLDTAEC